MGRGRHGLVSYPPVSQKTDTDDTRAQGVQALY